MLKETPITTLTNEQATKVSQEIQERTKQRDRTAQSRKQKDPETKITQPTTAEKLKLFLQEYSRSAGKSEELKKELKNSQEQNTQDLKELLCQAREYKKRIPQKVQSTPGYVKILEEIDGIHNSLQLSTPITSSQTKKQDSKSETDDGETVRAALEELYQLGNSGSFEVYQVKNPLERIERSPTLKKHKDLADYTGEIRLRLSKLSHSTSSKKTAKMEEPSESQQLHYLLIYQVLAAYNLYALAMSHRSIFKDMGDWWAHGNDGVKHAQSFLLELDVADFKDNVQSIADFFEKKPNVNENSFATYLLYVLSAYNGFISLINYPQRIPETIGKYARTPVSSLPMALTSPDQKEIQWVAPSNHWNLYLVNEIRDPKYNPGHQFNNKNSVFLANNNAVLVLDSGVKYFRTLPYRRGISQGSTSTPQPITPKENPSDVRKIILESIQAAKLPETKLSSSALFSTTNAEREKIRESTAKIFKDASFS